MVVTIGNATLILGDCLEILPTLPKVDAVIVDPPYGIGESDKRNVTRRQLARPVDYGKYDWDNQPASHEVIDWCAQAPKSIIWGGNYFAVSPASKWLVWDKINSGDFADCELAWTNLPGAVRIFRHMWNGMLRDSEREQRVHPTQKPVALMEWCVALCGLTEPSVIADLYAGSGPVGVAAIRAGHKYIGVEREPKYFDIACERIENAQRQAQMFPETPSKEQQLEIDNGNNDR
jgi:DNA modification methylase